MTSCSSCAGALSAPASPDSCVAPTCASMLCAALNAYNALMVGVDVVEVQFGEQRVKVGPKSIPLLLDHIRRLHLSCPSEASAAVLGLGGGGGGPIGVSFGARRGRCGC